MTQRSKSTLFLIEQLIVIAVFAICAVACISILTTAFFYATDSKATSHAVLKAESAAEVFKTTGDDFAALASILGGSASPVSLSKGGVSVVTVYYDNTWYVSDEANAGFVLHLVIESVQTIGEHDFISGNVFVERISGEELVTLKVAVRHS